MNLTIKMNLDNASFDDEYEIARILGKLGEKIIDDTNAREGSIMDANGNKVGSWTLKGKR